jgi:hypothetical protein
MASLVLNAALTPDAIPEQGAIFQFESKVKPSGKGNFERH